MSDLATDIERVRDESVAHPSFGFRGAIDRVCRAAERSDALSVRLKRYEDAYCAWVFSSKDAAAANRLTEAMDLAFNETEATR
jgi:hypothetical protein